MLLLHFYLRYFFFFFFSSRRRHTRSKRDWSSDVCSSDLGGKVPLVTTLCIGAPQVAALQILVYHKFLRFAKIVFTVVNHQPAFLTFVKEIGRASCRERV